MSSPLLLLKKGVPAALGDALLAESKAWYADAKRTVKIMGHVIPRDEMAVFFDGEAHDKLYRYSNHNMPTMEPTPLLEELRRLAMELGSVAGPARCELDLLVMNQYMDGKDSVGWHADDEPLIDQTAPIVSFSFNEANGARKFYVRTTEPPADGAKRKSAVYVLDHCDVAVMPPGMQATHQHAIQKEPRATGRRINLTFRATTKHATKKRRNV